jgi:phosphoglycerate dehydrogenase-like enzyme
MPPSSLLAILSPDERGKFFSADAWRELESIATTFRVLDPTGRDAAALHREIAAIDPEILLAGWQTPSLPAVLPPRLRYVCYLTGSVRRLVTRGQIERGLVITNWGSAISRIVAECALFHTLACLRQATRWTLLIHRDGGWRDNWESVQSLFERRVGLHGFGAVARALVELLRPFRCRIAVSAPDVDDAQAAKHGVHRAASLEALFAENDVIIEVAPLNAATTGSVTERHLRLIHPGGVFVNVGRGAVVDEAALLRVAREGQIQIGLDVFVAEPLPPDSGFRGLPNVSISPHIAGPTLDRFGDAATFALRNLRAYAAGQPLQAVITPEAYDQST